MSVAVGFGESASMAWLVENTMLAENVTGRAEAAVDSLLEMAKLAFRQNRWEDFVRVCESMTESARNTLAVQRMRAKALAGLGKFEESLVVWHAVSALAPGIVEGPLNIARIERRLGRWPETLRAARQVLASEPRHAEALSLAGQAFVKHHAAEDGKHIWSGLAQVNFDQLRDFQAQLESAERWSEAAHALRALIDAQPDNSALQQEQARFVDEVLERGKAQENWQDFGNASIAYRSVVIADPANAEAPRLLRKMTRPLIAAAREKLKEKDYPEAGKLFTESLLYDPAESAAMTGMARVYDALQDWKQSEDLWSKITAVEPSNDAAWLRLGIACGRNQNFEKGIAAFKSIRDAELLVQANEQVGRLGQAAFKAARVLFLSADHLKASQVLAIAETQNGADDSTRNLREKITRGLRAEQQKAQEQRDTAKVARLGAHIVLGRDGDISAWTIYARALYAQKQMTECIAAWQKVAALDPMRVEAKLGIARACLSLGQTDGCIAAAQAVLALDPGEIKATEILNRAQQLRSPADMTPT